MEKVDLLPISKDDNYATRCISPGNLAYLSKRKHKDNTFDSQDGAVIRFVMATTIVVQPPTHVACLVVRSF